MKLPSDKPMSNGGNLSKYKIDFIDPLFAVAIHIGFVEGVLQTDWGEHLNWPSIVEHWIEFFYFAIGLLFIVLSWDGYHKSIEKRSLQSNWRFILDVVLVMIYALLLLNHQHPTKFIYTIVIIYFFYVLWDVGKPYEYPKLYGLSSGWTIAGTFKVYIDSLCGGANGKAAGEIVTIWWFFFFIYVWYFHTQNLFLFGNPWVLLIAVCVGAFLYRSDKKRRWSPSLTGWLVSGGLFVVCVVDFIRSLKLPISEYF